MKFIYSDSLDFVDPRYDFLTDRSPSDREIYWDDLYPHEILGHAPYDGLLISRAIVSKKSANAKYTAAQALRLSFVGAREFMRYPEGKYPNSWVLGDCGAFSYHKEKLPPYSIEDTVEFYGQCGFTHGCSVDHVIFEHDETARGMNFGVIEPEKAKEAQRRFEITLENAHSFLKASKQLGRQFTPIGVIQGWSPDSMALAAEQLQAMGYKYIAAGGMVPLKTPQIHACLTAIREKIGASMDLHILGFAKADEIREFEHYNITIFDSTSPLLRAFKDQKSNYFLPGKSGKLTYYSAIRIPQATENLTMTRLVKFGLVKQEKLIALERCALDSIRAYDRGQASLETTLDAVMEYTQIFLTDVNRGVDSAEEGRTEERLNVLRERYLRTLSDRPWKACDCAICSEISVEVIIFRASNRNKRRGIHNLHVYHKHVHDTEGLATRDEETDVLCD